MPDLPADYPHDISYRTAFTGPELTRIGIPCRRDRFTAKDGPDCNWPTPEPPHRINQIFLEPILFEHAAAQAAHPHHQPDLGRGGAWWMILRERQPARSRNGSVRRLRCRYLIGCDGARSVVRKAIGAELSRRRHRAAGAVDLYPRARPDRSPGYCQRLGHRLDQSAPLAAWCMRSTAASAGWCIITEARRDRFRIRSIATPASAPSSASMRTSTTRSSPRKTGSAAG